jgi:hypothetical protein
MSDRESTAVGYRLRGFAPSNLATYPDRVKLMYWQWVVDLGLGRKDKELARGWDKDGKIHRLKPATIKHRKSEVGPVHPTAPRLIPALNLSRVRSLLTGRAHTTSAEFWWKFDSVTGASFAVILHYAAEAGHDVFGLSPQGTAWVAREATKRWRAWIAAGGGIRATQEVPGVFGGRKTESGGRKKESVFLRPLSSVLRPVKKVDLTRYDLTGGEKSLIEKAIAAGRFRGFRRLNMRGEQWKPQR